MDQIADEVLVEEVKKGNVGAFETIVRRYQGKLLSLVYHIVHNEDDAKDIVQESFVSIYKTINSVDSSKKFSSYIFVVVKNTAFSYLRAHHHKISLNEVELAEEDSVLFEQLYAADEKKRVTRALSLLSAKYRIVILLYYFDDLSYEEISEKMNLPLNTVRTHLKRAKDALRQILQYETI